MSRWIDAEWLLDYFADDIDYYGKYVREDIEDNMPTIDIVRCSECKYNNETYVDMTPPYAHHYCYTFSRYTNADDFCSYGQRKEGDMEEAWNLGDGLENVCRSVLRKAHYAAIQTEDRPRTIINLDSYEITALIWAMNEYLHNGQFAERI